MSADRNSGRTFCVRLHAVRSQRGLGQAELGELAGIPATSISHFESGKRKPSLDNLRKLADALKVSIDYLLGRTDDMSSYLNATAFRHEDRMTQDDLELMENIRKLLATRAKPGEHR